MTTQPWLFVEAIDLCDRGKHGTPVFGSPQDLGDAVNLDGCCPTCGRRIAVQSWTKAAYVQKFGAVESS